MFWDRWRGVGKHVSLCEGRCLREWPVAVRVHLLVFLCRCLAVGVSMCVSVCVMGV